MSPYGITGCRSKVVFNTPTLVEFQPLEQGIYEWSHSGSRAEPDGQTHE